MRVTSLVESWLRDLALRGNGVYSFVNGDVKRYVKKESEMDTILELPRRLHAVSPPLGAYFRVGHNDHTVLLRALSGDALMSGLVFDPYLDGRHTELRMEALRCGREVVLDSMSL